jgi:hypothetical protein
MSGESNRTVQPDIQSGYDQGGTLVGRFGIIAHAMGFIFVSIFMVYCLIEVWPVTADTFSRPGTSSSADTQKTSALGVSGSPESSTSPTQGNAAATPNRSVPEPLSLTIAGLNLRLSKESGFFIVVILLGALGAMVHVLRSFSWYVGNRSLRTSWLITYYMWPAIGGLMALIFYLVLRGGLIPSQQSSQAFNPYGFATIAALVGLFSEQAAEKLKQVFEIVFASAPKGKNFVPPHSTAIESFSPIDGKVGSEVIIRGKGFSNTSSVQFGDVPAIIVSASEAEIRVAVPPNAKSGRLHVTVGDATVASAQNFTVIGT